MKKLIAICMLSVILLASCTPKTQSGSQAVQSNAVSNSSSAPKSSEPTKSKPHADYKVPSSVPRTKSGIDGEDAKYPVEKLDIKLSDITNDFITAQNGIMFSYQPLPALPEDQGGGKRLYQIKFEDGEMYWYYGLVESEYVYKYKGFYTLVQDGMIEATLQNESDEADEMNLLIYVAVPQKPSADDVVLQMKMLSCSNNFFGDMADIPLVYHSKG